MLDGVGGWGIWPLYAMCGLQPMHVDYFRVKGTLCNKNWSHFIYTDILKILDHITLLFSLHLEVIHIETESHIFILLAIQH